MQVKSPRILCMLCMQKNSDRLLLIDTAPRVNSGRTDSLRIAMICNWHSENMMERTY